MNISLIPVCLGIYGLFLATMFLCTPGKIILKAGVCLSFVVLSTSVILSLKSYMGYPTTENLQFEQQSVEWIIQNEPHGDQPGRIFIWLSSDKSQHNSSYNPFVYRDANAPRAIEIPYNQDTDKAMKTATAALQQGNSVYIKNIRNISAYGKHAPEIIVHDPRNDHPKD